MVRFADAEVVVDRIEPTLGLDGKAEIPVPIAPARDFAAGRPEGQGKKARIRQQELFAINPNLRIKISDRRRAMVITIIGQQHHPQGEPAIRTIGS